jgi:hypothetical protein
MSGGMKMYGKHRFRKALRRRGSMARESTQLMLLQKWLESEGCGLFQRWNSSPLVRDVTKRGKKSAC